MRWREGDNGRPPTAGFCRSVAKGEHKVGSPQDLPHNFPLDADTFTMDDAHGGPAFEVGLLEIGFHNPLHITPWDRVQIEDIRKLDYELFIS